MNPENSTDNVINILGYEINIPVWEIDEFPTFAWLDWLYDLPSLWVYGGGGALALALLILLFILRARRRRRAERASVEEYDLPLYPAERLKERAAAIAKEQEEEAVSEELVEELPGEQEEEPQDGEFAEPEETLAEEAEFFPEETPMEKPVEAVEIPPEEIVEEVPEEQPVVPVPEVEIAKPEAVVVPEREEVIPEVEEEEVPTKESLFKRLRSGLSKTSDKLVGKIENLFKGKAKIDEDLLDDLEEILVTADLGINTSMNLIESVREQVSKKELEDVEVLKTYLKQKIFWILKNAESPLEVKDKAPYVIMVVGVNGVGKTTTIAKLARQFTKEGKSVLLAAGDTFRAAAIEQLEIWADRVGAEIVKQKSGADPAAVVYDAIEAATSREFDIVIIDTAGRLHTKVNLMEELKKIKRVIKKRLPEAPHEVLLVLDATTGQNAINQAKIFNDAIIISGIAITKLDGTAKGGVIVGVCEQLNLPVRFIGIGEKMDDLRPFNAQDFVSALFD